MSDTIHNLNVVREALEPEGLAVHVKLIDQAIENISSPPQAVQLPPIPIHWARPKGDTFDEMRDNVWKTGLATGGDTILIWVNEGDFLHAQIVFGAVEYPQLTRPESKP